MIAPLRRWHRRSTAALAVAVPALLVAAIASRPEAPVNASLPTGPVSVAAVTSRPLAWTRANIRAELVILQDGSVEVALDAATLAVEPDVLVYWLASDEREDPPAAGRLLGAVRGESVRRITLPAGTRRTGGRLVLYSLAHDEVLASTTVDASGGQP